MRPLIVLLLLIAGFISPAVPYPIDPRPLRKLIIEAEYIVTGHVAGIRIDKRSKGPDEYYAQIRISEVLKGSITDELIEVAYNPYYICPAPPRYEANTDVVVFLGKHKRDHYYTHALSYGLKTLPLAGIAVYRQRIIEMQQILTMQNEDEQFLETVEWLVKCAEHPVTRWEGTFELSPESDFMSFYSRSEKHPYQYMLSKQQKDRLKAALFADSETRYADLALVDVVFPEHPEAVHAYLLKTLKSLKAQDLWLAGDYMRRVMYTINGPALDALVERFSEKQFQAGKAADLQAIVNEFVALVEAEEGKPAFNR